MWESGLIALSLLAAAISVLLGFGYWWTMRNLGTIPLIDEPDEGPWRLSVVVPARNEELDLQRALQSILAQHSVDIELVVVNDHSTDGTRAIAERLAQQDSRVRVIHDPPLAAGWLGKANAMQQGLAATTREHVLFTDADVLHDPRCFVSALRAMRAQEQDFVSFCPNFQCVSFWENALLPHAYIAGTVQFSLQRTNDPRSPNAAAAGAFMLTRRAVLDALGGLACVRMEMLDDIALAKAVKAGGYATRLWRSEDLVTVRLFKGNRDAFWGLTKNILGAVDHVAMAFPAMLLPVFMYWVPLVTLGMGLASARPALIVAGLLPYVIQAALLLLVRPMCQMRGWKALCFPLAVVPVLCCFTKAIYHRLASGSVAWRGRVIAVGK